MFCLQTLTLINISDVKQTPKNETKIESEKVKSKIEDEADKKIYRNTKVLTYYRIAVRTKSKTKNAFILAFLISY